MKIAIVHYHLEPGGVTRVIENTLKAWADSGHEVETVVLSGRKYKGNQIANTQEVEGLDYATAEKSMDASILKDRLTEKAIKSLGEMPDLWHVHNHSLGKNPALTSAVSILADEGERLLLHPHDFAEDGRPQNFKAITEVYRETYPSSPGIHYATLNNRDHSFVSNLFADTASKVHLLANAIPQNVSEEIPTSSDASLPANFILYPVRAVRRKNLGELALLAAAYPEKHFANSLKPTNPTFRPQFERWKAFARETELPLSYGIGHQVECSFPEMVSSAEAIVTTSMAEGFGLGYLEPWGFGKSLCGRNLPEITGDFSKLGVNLDHLYNRLELDVGLLENKELLFTRIEKALDKFFKDYGEELPQQASEEAKNSIVRDDLVDFGRLDESFQERLILSAIKSEETKKAIRQQCSLNPLPGSIIKANSEAIRDEFSMIAYGEKLIQIYQEILQAKKGKVEYADGKNLLRQFLSPSRLNLLLTN